MQGSVSGSLGPTPEVQGLTAGDFFSLFDNACPVTAGSDGRDPAEGNTRLLLGSRAVYIVSRDVVNVRTEFVQSISSAQSEKWRALGVACGKSKAELQILCRTKVSTSLSPGALPTSD